MIAEDFSIYLTKEGVSMSSLKKLKVSPKHYHEYVNGKKEDEENKNLIIGTAIHHYILEPDVFKNRYVCLTNDMLPVANKNGVKNYQSKENREYRDSFKEKHKDKIVIDESDYEFVKSLGESACSIDKIKKLFKVGISEVSCYKTDPKTGLILKGRVDRINTKASLIIDIKTCADASPIGFQRAIKQNSYYNQAKWYLDLFDQQTFLFCAIEKSDSKNCELYSLDEKFLNQAMRENRMLLDILFWCKKNNEWPDYGDFQALKAQYKKYSLYDAGADETIQRLDEYVKEERSMFYELSWDNYYDIEGNSSVIRPVMLLKEN